MTTASHAVNPRLDLVLERFIDVPSDLVWRAWTEPELLKQWFTPKPWSTVECEVDLRPGGVFRTVIRSPEGEEFGRDSAGCYLEVVPGRRLVWTDALEPGFRPAKDNEGLKFTAVISIEPEGSGTRYIAVAMHRDEEGRQAHEAMGFHEGWGKALEQLVALAKQL